MNGLFDLLDGAVADWLNMDTTDFIRKIEQCTWAEMNFIIFVALNEREDKKEKALLTINKYG